MILVTGNHATAPTLSALRAAHGLALPPRASPLAPPAPLTIRAVLLVTQATGNNV